MDPSSFQTFIFQYGIYSGTFLASVISGFVPIVNVELILIFIAYKFDPSFFIPVVIWATVGQMAAKVITYYAGKGVIKIPLKKQEDKIEEIRQKLEKWQSKSDFILFLSAFVGFPPYYLVSILAGMMHLNFWSFLITGLIGRGLRFGLLMYFPHLFEKFL